MYYQDRMHHRLRDKYMYVTAPFGIQSINLGLYFFNIIARMKNLLSAYTCTCQWLYTVDLICVFQERLYCWTCLVCNYACTYPWGQKCNIVQILWGFASFPSFFVCNRDSGSWISSTYIFQYSIVFGLSFSSSISLIYIDSHHCCKADSELLNLHSCYTCMYKDSLKWNVLVTVVCFHSTYREDRASCLNCLCVPLLLRNCPQSAIE